MSGQYMPGSTQPLEIFCPHCGRANAPGMNFCNQCGNSLAGASVSVPGAYPPQQPQQPQPYYPPPQPPPAPPYYRVEQPSPQAAQPGYVMPPPMQTQYATYAPAPVMVANRPQKSVALAFFLALLFGPLGLLYSSAVGGIVMLLVTAGAWTLFFMLIVNRMDFYAPLYTDSGIPWVTLLALAIWIAVEIICIIWAIAAVSSYNNKFQATGAR